MGQQNILLKHLIIQKQNIFSHTPWIVTAVKNLVIGRSLRSAIICLVYKRKASVWPSTPPLPVEFESYWRPNSFEPVEHFIPLNLHIGWLGWAMVLGSFPCRGVLLLLHIVGQGPAVVAGWVGYIFFIIFYLSFLSNVLSFGRLLNMTDTCMLWFWLLNPNGSCQLLPRTSSFSTG